MFPFLSLSLSFFKQQQKNSFIFSVKTNPTTNLPSFHFIHFTLHTFISHFHLIFTLTHPQSNNKNTFIISLSLINSLSQPTKSPYKLYIIQIPTHTTINISSRQDRKTVQHEQSNIWTPNTPSTQSTDQRISNDFITSSSLWDPLLARW